MLNHLHLSDQISRAFLAVFINLYVKERSSFHEIVRMLGEIYVDIVTVLIFICCKAYAEL